MPAKSFSQSLPTIQEEDWKMSKKRSHESFTPGWLAEDFEKTKAEAEVEGFVCEGFVFVTVKPIDFVFIDSVSHLVQKVEDAYWSDFVKVDSSPSVEAETETEAEAEAEAETETETETEAI
jgi:hypothetical protein